MKSRTATMNRVDKSLPAGLPTPNTQRLLWPVTLWVPHTHHGCLEVGGRHAAAAAAAAAVGAAGGGVCRLAPHPGLVRDALRVERGGHQAQVGQDVLQYQAVQAAQTGNGSQGRPGGPGQDQVRVLATGGQTT